MIVWQREVECKSDSSTVRQWKISARKRRSRFKTSVVKNPSQIHKLSYKTVTWVSQVSSTSSQICWSANVWRLNCRTSLMLSFININHWGQYAKSLLERWADAGGTSCQFIKSIIMIPVQLEVLLFFKFYITGWYLQMVSVLYFNLRQPYKLNVKLR